jgi:hypothetical protein
MLRINRKGNIFFDRYFMQRSHGGAAKTMCTDDNSKMMSFQFQRRLVQNELNSPLLKMVSIVPEIAA